MPTYDHTTIIGHLTRDPETKFLSNEKCVANFTLAVNRKYKDKEEVAFLDCEAWGKTAELVGQYLTKGRACLVNGYHKQENWEKDGQKRSKIKIVVEKVVFLGDKGDKTTEHAEITTAPARTERQVSVAVAQSDSDIPF